MKYLPLLLLFFVFNATAQSFESKEEAIRRINRIMKNSPEPKSFKMDDVGIVTIQDLKSIGVNYTFYIRDIKPVEYEREPVFKQHRIKFTCATRSPCFQCDKESETGLTHFLYVNSDKEASVIITAFDFLMKI